MLRATVNTCLLQNNRNLCKWYHSDKVDISHLFIFSLWPLAVRKWDYMKSEWLQEFSAKFCQRTIPREMLKITKTSNRIRKSPTATTSAGWEVSNLFPPVRQRHRTPSDKLRLVVHMWTATQRSVRESPWKRWQQMIERKEVGCAHMNGASPVLALMVQMRPKDEMGVYVGGTWQGWVGGVWVCL